MNPRLLPRGASDRLARIRLSPGQIQVAVLLCAVLSIGSLGIAFATFSSRVEVAQREARRVAAEQVEQQRASCAFWRDLGAFEAWEASSRIGRTLVTDARTAANALDCP